MKLVSVYKYKGAVKILYELLKTRPPEACISHKKMPSYEKHKKFVRSAPYKYWYIITSDMGSVMGAIYLSRNNEIGAWTYIQGYEEQAIKLLMNKHPQKRFLANVSINHASRMRLFEGLGFKLLQRTYEKTA